MTKAGLTWWKSNDSGVAPLLPGIFPEPDKDPVIQIASMVQRQGETEPFIRTVFTLQSCASIVGSQILCFTQETRLLQVYTCTLKALKCIHSLIWFLCFLSSHIFLFCVCMSRAGLSFWGLLIRTLLLATTSKTLTFRTCSTGQLLWRLDGVWFILVHWQSLKYSWKMKLQHVYWRFNGKT